MRLLKLTAENFGRHTQAEFDFTDETIIRGRNASGKSTLAQAVVWCLFGANLEGKSKDDKNLMRDRARSMQVTTEWITDQQRILRITRIKPEGGPIHVTVNGRTVKPGEIEGWFFRKDVFLSIFNARYFGQLEPKDAKSVLADVIPNIEVEDVLKGLSHDHQAVLHHETFGMGIDSVECLARTLRKEIANQGSEWQRLKGTKDAYTETLTNGVPTPPKVSMDQKAKQVLEKARGEKRALEQAWETRSTQLNDLRAQLGQARQLYRLRQSALQQELTTQCPMCNQNLSEDQIADLRIKANDHNQTVEDELKLLRLQGRDLTTKIERLMALTEPDVERLDAIIEQYAQVEALDLESLATYRAESQVYQMALKNLTKVEQDIDAIQSYITELRTKLDACQQLAFEFVRVQNKKLDGLFDKVRIRLTRHNPDTGEMIRDFRIEYNGKRFSSLSNSERIRCGIEIGRVLSTPSGESMPTFVDDAESVADLFSETFSGQVIAAYMFDCELMVEGRDVAETTLLEETKHLLQLVRKGA